MKSFTVYGDRVPTAVVLAWAEWAEALGLPLGSREYILRDTEYGVVERGVLLPDGTRVPDGGGDE